MADGPPPDSWFETIQFRSKPCNFLIAMTNCLCLHSNADLSWKVFIGIHLRPISQVFMSFHLNIRSESNHYTFRITTKSPRDQWVTSSPPSATYMRQWTVSVLVQTMVCRLIGAKPLPEPMLAYCRLESWEQISMKLESEFYHFHSRKCIWKCHLPNWRPFCPGEDELRQRQW